MWYLDSYPLAEEIGDPNVFVGREKEMKRLLKWAENAKPRRSKSLAILSRRKKGKTALLQRFFNVLYHRNDPRLIPFYYRIPEAVQSRLDFTKVFYRRVLTQYLAFTTRTPSWVGQVLPMEMLVELTASDKDLSGEIRAMAAMFENEPSAAWPYAQEVAHRISQLKDVRILQILDEFQYMNKYIVADDGSGRVELLCHSYMGAAESKYSPQIVAGSHIGWLEVILRHLTARYNRWRLEGLSDTEAVEAVYNYAAIHQVNVTEETAPYVAEVCYNDPYYIAATVGHHPEDKDLTTEEGVREALTYETMTHRGDIAYVWGEYLAGAFDRVNKENSKKIVLYLAKYEPEPRRLDQIREDLKLDLTEQEVEDRLHKLVMADILAPGPTAIHYQGLGDRIFSMVFRRLYGAQIDRISVDEIDTDFKKELASLKGRLSVQRGALAELRVRYRLLVASLRGATLADLVFDGGGQGDPTPMGPFQGIRKAHFYLTHETNVEIDLHAVSENDDGTDLMIEVKDWDKGPQLEVVRRFVEVKTSLEGQLKRKTAFLFYSESGLSDRATARLEEAGILLLDPKKLAGFESFPQ